MLRTLTFASATVVASAAMDHCHIKDATVYSDLVGHECSITFGQKCYGCSAQWDPEHKLVALTCVDQFNTTWEDACNRFPKITVSYTGFKLLGGLKQCDVDKYRLFYNSSSPTGDLTLVGLYENGTAVDPAYEGKLKPFQVAEKGIFDGVVGEKWCLLATHEGGIALNKDPNNDCTSKNTFDSQSEGLWHFQQGWAGDVPLCMATPIDADACDAVIPASRFRVGSPSGSNVGCGGGWTMEPFVGPTELRSSAVPPSCEHCRKQYGTFSCSTPSEGCTVAPDHKLCEVGLSGTWCSGVHGKQCHIVDHTKVISDIPGHNCSAEFLGGCDDCKAVWDAKDQQVNMSCIEKKTNKTWLDNCKESIGLQSIVV